MSEYNRAQVFLYFYGPGATGKSTVVNTLAMIVGVFSFTTTLRDLAGDKFECLHIAGKRVILIQDTDTYHGDMSVVKAISGGDTLQGRIKHSSETIEITPQAKVVITGNQLLQTRDVSGAITRRMRLIKMDRIVPASV